MPAYNYQAQHASKVESGEKTQTIRKKRKRPTVVGDIMYNFTGMRTKHCRRLGEDPVISVEDFFLPDNEVFRIGDDYDHAWFIAEEDDAGLMLAKADGFNSWEDFVKFFEAQHGLPFEGEIIKWRKI